MKGKSLVFLLALVFCLCAFMLESAPLQAKEWTAEQKEIVQMLQKHAEASEQADVDEIMKDFHPQFSGWDLAQTPPMFDKGPYDKEFCSISFEEYFKLYKMISFEIEPLEIVVEGDFAIAQCSYKETIEDSKGTVTEASGRLSASLVKKNNKWAFLSWAWIAIE
jgi:ketosteroid isomerase-like protein